MGGRIGIGCLVACLALASDAQAAEEFVSHRLDVQPGEIGSDPYSLTPFGNQLLFWADDGEHGNELWRTGGTEGTTQIVKDITPNDSEFTDPDTFVEEDVKLNSLYLFTAYDFEAEQDRLWRTDGTGAGTQPLMSSENADIFNLTRFGNSVFFAAYDPMQGLWKTDGTAAPTLVKALPDLPLLMTPVGDTLYFVVDEFDSWTLWKSNGTTAGTVPVYESEPGESVPAEMTAVGTTLYFSDGGQYLWHSNGTEAGTTVVHDFGEDGSPERLREMNGILYFAAWPGDHGSELWRSDGTEFGTYEVKDIYPGETSSLYAPNASGTLLFDTGPFFSFGTTLLLPARSPGSGVELWRSDGTEAGTSKVKEIYPQDGDGGPGEFVERDGIVYMTAQKTGLNAELWQTDGTGPGTIELTDLNPVYEPTPVGAEDVFFSGSGIDPFDDGNELYVGRMEEVPDRPETEIVKATINKKKGKASFAFNGNLGAGATGPLRFECNLGGSNWSDCTSPKSYRRLSRGKYKFSVRAVDGDEREDQSPAEKSFKSKRCC